MEPNQNYTPAPHNYSAPTHSPPQPSKKPRGISTQMLAFGVVYLLILIIAVATVYSSKDNQLESVKHDLASAQAKLNPDASQYIEHYKYQAVFLSNGQTYFGKIETVNQKYMTISDVFYLKNGAGQQQPASSSTTTSIIKLGCELHGPEDEMTINLDRVDFWENLQNSGQVVKAIDAFNKQNPDGQRCS